MDSRLEMSRDVSPDGGPPDTHDTRPNEPGTNPEGLLQIRCPHCHQRIELDSERITDLVVCNLCGTSFSLLSEGDTTYKVPAQKRVGQFELIDQVGVGSFGSVWKARDTTLDRVVAVKVPRKGQLSPEEVELFLREARAAAQLKHANIVAVHEVGRDEDVVFIVSDLIRGVSLADYLSGQRLTQREAATLCSKIAIALDHAHDKGVVHRDLKPGNILVDAAGEPHITDFGLAKREVGEVTMTRDGRVMGTPAYMSPEQAAGDAHAADRRSDVYSLGVILFVLLTGELPFRGNQRMLIHQILNEDPPLPRRFDANVNRDLEAICVKCLEKSPERRYQTAGELADELDRYLEGRPIKARRIGPVTRLWKWCRRRPGATVATAVVAACVLTLTIGALIDAGRQRDLAADRLALVRHEESLRQQSQDSLHDVLLRHATALRLSRQPGYRTELTDVLHQAAAIDTTRRDPARVRRELLACLGDPIAQKPLDTPPPQVLAFDWDETASTGQGSRSARKRGTSQLEILDENEGVIATLPRKLSLGHVYDHAFSPEGHELVVAHEEGISVWEVPAMIRTSLKRSDVVYDVAMHPGGAWFASVSRTQRVELHSLASGRVLADLGLVPSARYLSFSDDGDVLVAFDGSRKFICGWNVSSTPEKRYFPGHRGGVTGVALSASGEILASCSKDQTVRIWDVPTGQLRHVCRGHDRPVESVVFHPNGKYVFSGDWDGVVIAWSTESGQELARVRKYPPLHQVWKMALSSDGQFLAVVGTAGLLVYRVAEEEDKLTFSQQVSLSTKNLRDAAFRPDTTELVYAQADGPMYWLDYVSGVLRHTLPTQVRRATSGGLQFSSDGNRLHFARDDALWGALDWQRGREQDVPRLSLPHGNFAHRERSNWVCAQSENSHQTVFYDSSTGDVLLGLPPESSDVWEMALHADRQRLALAMADGSLVVWDLGAVGEALSQFELEHPFSTTSTPTADVPLPAPLVSEEQLARARVLRSKIAGARRALKQPPLEPVTSSGLLRRQGIYRALLGFIDQLAQEFPQSSDLDIARLTAEADMLTESAKYQRELGDPAEALGDHQRAIELLKDGGWRAGNELALGIAWAKANGELSATLDCLQRKAEAQAAAEEAFAFYEGRIRRSLADSLAHKYAKQASVHEALGRIFGNRSVELRELRWYRVGQRAARQAIEESQAAIEIGGATNVSLVALGMAHNYRAFHLAQLGDIASARRDYDRAIELLSGLTHSPPTKPTAEQAEEYAARVVEVEMSRDTLNAQANWTIQCFDWSPHAVLDDGTPDWEKTVAQPPVREFDAQIVDFLISGSPAYGVGTGRFAIVAQGEVVIPKGEVELYVCSDEGVRVQLDGESIISNWQPHTWQRDAKDSVFLQGDGNPHHIRIEFYEVKGLARLQLGLRPLGK